MMRWTAVCACLSWFCAGVVAADEPLKWHGPKEWILPSASLAAEPCIPDQASTRLTLRPEVVALPARDAKSGPFAELPHTGCRSQEEETQFLTKRRWAPMPALELVEEPLPSPMSIAYPRTGAGALAETPKVCPAGPERYAVEAAADQAPPPRANSDEFPGLSLPTPMADPAAMVIELFEKLKVAQERAADARRQLAETQQQLAEVRSQTISHASTGADYSQQNEIVMLELRLFELDLDGTAASDAELESLGVEPCALSRGGLGALVAEGAFRSLVCCPACPSGCTSEAACPAAACASCTPDGGAVAETPRERRAFSQYVEDRDRFEQLLILLEDRGLVRNINRPRLMTRSGQQARMRVGRVIPVQQEGAPAEAVEFVEAGTRIDVEPIVHADGMVSIKLHAEWSTVAENGPDQARLAVEEQAIDTMLVLPAGEMAVVAGLVREKGAVAGVPQIVGVPTEGGEKVFHPAGASRSTACRRSELVLLVTPKVVVPQVAAEAGSTLR